jgi:Flp pilus assembly protein TadG
MNTRPCPRIRNQRGVAAVEFALVSLFILFPLLFGIIELARIAFYWNAATEATRLGARLAVVCDLDDSTIRSRMAALFPAVAASNIVIAYQPAGCTTTTCRGVEVSILPARVVTHIPSVPLNFAFPPFRTTLPRESMRSSFGAAGAEVSNPVCE